MRTVLFTILSLSLATAACGSKRGEERRTGPLIERVGDADGIETVVADVSKRLPDHEVLGAKFAGVDMVAFEANLADELCAQVGGKCQAPESMLAARELDQDEYDLFVELFVVSMNEAAIKLPTKEQNDLIDALFAMREKHAAGRTASAEDAE
jgi:hypothetical protein